MRKEESVALVGVVNASLPATSPIEQNFADLYRRHCERAVREAAWFVNDHDVAWDAVQTAALKLFKTWERLRPEQKTVQYFIRAVHHRVIEHLRREQKYVDLSEDVEREVLDSADADVPDAVIASDQLIEAALIAPIIKSMPLRCREVWVLFKEQEFTYAEIAETLGLTETTVRRHMSRAIEMLRKGLRKAGLRFTDTTVKGLLPPSTAEDHDV